MFSFSCLLCALRPGECLHYCAPGPHDEWQRILYHHLSLQNPEFIRELEEDQFHASEKVELSAYIAAEDDENRREI